MSYILPLKNRENRSVAREFKNAYFNTPTLVGQNSETFI